MKSKNGFTLIELLAVIVVLAIIVLLAVTAAVPMMNRAKKSSLADEALAYIRAAKQAYTVENMDGQTSACYDISYLNEKYIMKEDNNYQGMVIVSGPINDINFSISLSNGKFYVVKNNASKVTISDVSNSKPSGYAASCGSYNSVLSNEVNTNSLVYKLIMANGKSTLEANLNDIETRTESVNFNEMANTAAKSGIFRAQDDDGASYYYRGIVNNNWVSFAGFYWRIVRINGDGSIRMIYTGTASSDHTGNNATVKISVFGDTTSYTTTTPDVTGLTNTSITTSYSNGRFGNTYVGYMYNPAKVLRSYPTYDVDSTNNLNKFPYFTDATETKQYYFFKNFSLNDCFTGNDDDETGTCTLKCTKLGDDCILSTWTALQADSNNYSTSTSLGATSNYYLYTNPYKYTCWGYGTAVTKSNSNSTTSVYISCPLVSEVVGTDKNNTTRSRVKFHGLMSASEDTAYSNNKDSRAKIELESWYEANIYNKKDSFNKYYEDYIVDEIYCNDRSAIRDNQTFPYTYGDHYYFAALTRIKDAKSPTLKCANKGRDGFTLTNVNPTSIVTPNNHGNNKSKYPVGLLTADELNMAGGILGSTNLNTQFYLYTGANYWLGSPYMLSTSNGSAYEYYMHGNGFLSFATSAVSFGLRPVINLSPDVLFNSGNGTEANPYTVKLQ